MKTDPHFTHFIEYLYLAKKLQIIAKESGFISCTKQAKKNQIDSFDNKQIIYFFTDIKSPAIQWTIKMTTSPIKFETVLEVTEIIGTLIGFPEGDAEIFVSGVSKEFKWNIFDTDRCKDTDTFNTLIDYIKIKTKAVASLRKLK